MLRLKELPDTALPTQRDDGQRDDGQRDGGREGRAVVSDSDESSAHEDAMSAQEDAAVEGERLTDEDDDDEEAEADEEEEAAAAAADESDTCVAAAEESTWEVLSLLLGFTHRFEPADCARLLYTRLSRALLVRAERGEGGGEGEGEGGGEGEETEEDDEEDEEKQRDRRAELGTPSMTRHVERRADLIRAPHNWMVPNSAPTPTPLAARVSTLLDRLSIGALSTALSPRPSGLSFGDDTWPRVCSAGGMWLGARFFPFERCVWSAGELGDPYAL